MERKRKMPARAAARVEQAAKKGRIATPPAPRSATPSSAVNSTPAVEEDGVGDKQPQNPPPPPPAPLPTSIQPGKPLPTVEAAQPEDLPSKEYQSFQESGVLAESLNRSRQRWISDGLFERYWAKPIKKRGVVQEDPKNPPKESMTKIGQVTISLEPHYFEATMYAVKDPNKPASQSASRPVLQYGPPSGAMPPPPPPPSSKSETPATVPATTKAPTAVPPASAPPTPSTAPSPATSAPQQPIKPKEPTAGAAPQPSKPQPQTQPQPQQPQPRPQPQPQQTQPQPQQAKPQPQAHSQPQVHPLPPSAAPAAPAAPITAPVSVPAPQAPRLGPPSSTVSSGPTFPAPVLNPAPAPAPAPASVATVPPPPPGPPRGAVFQPTHNRPPQPAPGTDPIIVTLAEKANEDPELRDLMKRVANGNAPKEELARFQAVIDQITHDSKKRGGVKGPPAERLFVDGKTVRYFADEVDVIVSIILRTNPKQTSADLTPPANSNPLVVELVKKALDDPRTLVRVQRIAKGAPQYTDAVDLKTTLENLKNQLSQQRPQLSASSSSKANSATNGQAHAPAGQQSQPQPTSQQALRSKGPPPAVKPDVSAVVFEFGGGNGDRYLFPKFSIVEQIQTSWGPQVIVSFLIVRKGSASEYGGDPKLDYYQPVTIRISASQPRYLDYFSKVVAPEDEVRRYMEDIMDNMTRAEYVLLAMRLPRPKDEAKDKEDGPISEKEMKHDDSKHATPEVDDRGNDIYRKGLTWKKDKTMKLLAKPPPLKNSGKVLGEEESYQSFIASVSRKQTEDEE